MFDDRFVVQINDSMNKNNTCLFAFDISKDISFFTILKYGERENWIQTDIMNIILIFQLVFVKEIFFSGHFS